MRFYLGVPLILACLAPLACSVTTQGQVETASDVQPTLYYYGGPHFYPESLGGEWCSIGEPHAHDFPPDHPEWYAYDSGYYYYAGRPSEVYVVGTVPVGARIYVVHEHAPHGPYPLPAEAPRAPHVVTGRWPTREAHPAPFRPPPPQVVRRAEPRTVGERPAQYDPRRDDHRELERRAEPERRDVHPDDHHDDHHNDDHRAEPRRVDDHHGAEPNRMPEAPRRVEPAAQAQPMHPAAPGPNEQHRAPPPTAKRKKEDLKH